MDLESDEKKEFLHRLKAAIVSQTTNPVMNFDFLREKKHLKKKLEEMESAKCLLTEKEHTEKETGISVGT